MIIIGDIHGKVKEYRRIVGYNPSIQIGDFGYGFIDLDLVIGIGQNHKFFRGNHDDPKLCSEQPNYLGEFGPIDIDDKKGFFVSGAYSIDYKWRTPMVSWWPDEELNEDQMIDCRYKYADTLPEIVLSHECPSSVIPHLVDKSHKIYKSSRTSNLLQQLLESHKPKVWVFGHWHLDARLIINGVEFICLNELSTYDTETGIILPKGNPFLKLSKDWVGIL